MASIRSELYKGHPVRVRFWDFANVIKFYLMLLRTTTIQRTDSHLPKILFLQTGYNWEVAFILVLRLRGKKGMSELAEFFHELIPKSWSTQYSLRGDDLIWDSREKTGGQERGRYEKEGVDLDRWMDDDRLNSYSCCLPLLDVLAFQNLTICHIMYLTTCRIMYMMYFIGCLFHRV